MAASFKICTCCGTQVTLRKRVCPQCKVPALWRDPTPIEIAERKAADDRSDALLRELISKPTEECCA